MPMALRSVAYQSDPYELTPPCYQMLRNKGGLFHNGPRPQKFSPCGGPKTSFLKVSEQIRATFFQQNFSAFGRKNLLRNKGGRGFFHKGGGAGSMVKGLE